MLDGISIQDLTLPGVLLFSVLLIYVGVLSPKPVVDEYRRRIDKLEARCERAETQRDRAVELATAKTESDELIAQIWTELKRNADQRGAS